VATDAVADAAPEICFDPVPDIAELAAGPLEEAAAAGPFPYEDTFELHSNPTAEKVIYLDFDGHVTSGTSWNSNYNNNEDFTTPPFSFEGDDTFSDNELARIQQIWERVAEDYIPFNVDVTTEDPGVDALKKTWYPDREWGVRVCIGGSAGGESDWYPNVAGGVAYVGSFDNSSDTPCYVFTEKLSNGNEKYTAEAASHEVGHTLNLRHDGLDFDDDTKDEEYYNGHGSGATGWAPIMGTARYKEVSQWSKGEYPNSSRTEDDLQKITVGNGFSYRTDDHGSTRSAATPLTIDDGVNLLGEGIIERNTDVDFFSFTTAAGTIELDVDPFYRSPNLDIRADLYDASGNPVASHDPQGRLDALITAEVPAGTYYLSIDGVGDGDLITGYSDYGSLGYYSISATVAAEGTPESEIVARSVFYNNSAYDGDDAIATDKQALHDGGVATFANYTSYARGINGVIVDITEVPDGLVPTAEDFAFHVGNDATPEQWIAAPAPLDVTLIEDAGVDGSDRLKIVWNDYAIRNEWLQVTVRAANLGLPGDDVFYFGNALAESGDTGDDAKVTITDLLLARNNGRDFVRPAAVDFPYDYDRDSFVNATDVLLARNNQTSFWTALKLIDLPTVQQGEPVALLGDLAWLQEQEPPGAAEQSSSRDRPASQVTDLLLAHLSAFEFSGSSPQPRY